MSEHDKGKDGHLAILLAEWFFSQDNPVTLADAGAVFGKTEDEIFSAIMESDDLDCELYARGKPRHILKLGKEPA